MPGANKDGALGLGEKPVAAEILCATHNLLSSVKDSYQWIAVGLVCEQNSIKWHFQKSEKKALAEKTIDFSDLQKATIEGESSLARNIVAAFEGGCEELPYMWTCPEKKVFQNGIVIEARSKSDGLSDPYAKASENAEYFPKGYFPTIIPLVLRHREGARLLGAIVVCWDVTDGQIPWLLPQIKSTAIALLEAHRNRFGLFPSKQSNLEIKLLRPLLYNHDKASLPRDHFLFNAKSLIGGEYSTHDNEAQDAVVRFGEIQDFLGTNPDYSGGGFLKSFYCCFNKIKPDQNPAYLRTAAGYSMGRSHFEWFLNKFLNQTYPTTCPEISFSEDFHTLSLVAQPGILAIFALLQVYKALSGYAEDSSASISSVTKMEFSNSGGAQCCTFTVDYTDGTTELRKKMWKKLTGDKQERVGGKVTAIDAAIHLDFNQYYDEFRSDDFARENKYLASLFARLDYPCFDISFAPKAVSLWWMKK